MKCTNCGFENAPDAASCGQCGMPLMAEWPQPQMTQNPSGWQQPEGGEGLQSEDSGWTQVALRDGFASSNQSRWNMENDPFASLEQDGVQEPQSDGPFTGGVESLVAPIKKGFDAIAGGLGLPKAGLLSLLSVVPFLRWFYHGAVIRSGGDAFENNGNPPLSHIFELESLIMFLRVLGAAIVIGLACALLAFVLGFIPILGKILAVVLMFAVSIASAPYMYVASIRAARTRRFAAFLDVKQNVEIIMKDVVSVMVTTVVPTLIIGILLYLLSMIIVGGAGAAGTYGANTSGAAGIGIVIASLSSLFIFSLFASAVSGVTNLVIYVSMGIWMNECASEFLTEAPKPEPAPKQKQSRKSQTQQQPRQSSSSASKSYDGSVYQYTPPTQRQNPQPHSQPQPPEYQNEQPQGQTGFWKGE